ncbi:MAG: DUF1501 domain-containing protein [Gemmataceae bacterium]|nr:DUF1501 domain-containing protein [Gemmataceae bacterium]
MWSRRNFLKSSSLVACSPVVPAFLARTARAAPAGKDTILVMVQLTGGNDGLNTVIPHKHPRYAQYRPTLRVPSSQVKKVDDQFGLHPSLDGFAKLLEKQALGIVHGVGYPNPSQSHFRSMDIWNAGSTAESLSEGWLGKALRQIDGPAFHLAGNNESAPLALEGAPVRAPSVRSLDDFQLKLGTTTGAESRMQKSIIEGSAANTSGDGLLDFVRKTAGNTYDATRRLKEVAANYQPKVPYPQTGLANRLRLAAQLIDAGLGARIFYVSIDGFDTHSGQGGANGPHANLLAEVGNAIAAFYGDLAARGHGERVLIATFSEFGRRAQENGSRGTDHGSGAPMFLVGGRVRPGLIGEHPDLEKLEQGNLRHTCDFRSVYAAICEKWLGVPSEPLLGAKYPAANVFRA